ncbi:Binding-protein-dependent transport system inner membrane component [mine drainage metagenome]|uniref:Binding-protein-dependent transport system inner membrane component n=1 Tax=mine drainage metagenome TaxID=410659 RepID=T1CZN9_9ZZZZ
MSVPEASVVPPADDLAPLPSLRERYRRHAFGLEFWAGVGILAFYVAVALSALVEFQGTLATLNENPAWIPGWIVIGPSWTYPFGILSGFGVNLIDAMWQATPWDLSIVVAILAIDGCLGTLLGAIAGFSEGRWPDTVITFVFDSVGSIPGVFLLIIVFLGITALDPRAMSLGLFVFLFGLILCPTIARTVRERVRTVAQLPFVESARASGVSRSGILARHLLPNSLGPVLVQLPADVAAIFFFLTVFPWFYSCGGPLSLTQSPPWLVPALPPGWPLPSTSFPEWGFQLAIGACEGLTTPGLPIFWWMLVFPLLAIIGLGVGLGLLCDGIDKWLRPGS